MKRFVLAAVIAAAVMPAVASSVELKNVRASYGINGATRYDNRLWQGDVLFMAYDVEGLAVDAKSGRTKYVTKLELTDPANKTVTLNESLNEAIPGLGGKSMPGNLNIVTGLKQTPGQYTLTLTVTDKLGKDTKPFSYKFNVLGEGIGITNVAAPAVTLPGQYYVASFALANLTLVGAVGKKQPNVDITIKVLDQKGAEVVPATEILLPRDLSPDIDLEVTNMVPLTSPPIYCNRAGRFTMEVTANDKHAKKKVELRFTFSVLDIASFTGK